MKGARLEAVLLALLEDVVERRSPEQREAFAKRIADLADYCEQATVHKNAGSPETTLAQELRAVERFVARYPRLDP